MTNDERISDLLLVWEERFKQGQDVSAEELCRDKPHMTAALAACIKALKDVAWMYGEPTLTPAKLAGRYRLDELIAEGGYGQVWRGFDEELQRPVAVKLPKKGHQRPEETFLVEARKVARLRHPGIVPVFDVGRCDTGHFIVSDLVDGQDLRKRLHGNAIPVREAVRIVAEVARSLQYAHRQGFIHRDIKPGNILVDHYGKVFITDFGIALAEQELREGSNDNCGTLAHMSPEQLAGDSSRVDARTDIYSLGVVLYELLAGRLPFHADKPEMLRSLILRQKPVPPRSLNKAIPRAIERTCLKCLAKKPGDRYRTAEALSNDLARWLNGRELVWGMTTPRMILRVSTAILLAAMTVLACVWLLPRDGGHSPAIMPKEGGTFGVPPERIGPERVLFNGKNLAGWVAFRPEAVDGFHVESDGTLWLEGGPRGGYLRTEDKFTDFVLRLEYQLPKDGRVSANGSGVLLRMPGDFVRGRYLEANIGHGDTGDIWWAAGKRLTRYRLLNERPIGEWNEYVIICDGDKLTVVLNGQIVNDENVVERKGYIGIAPQGTDIWFRNIRLSPLTP